MPRLALIAPPLTPPVPVEPPVARSPSPAPPAGGDAPRERLAALGAEALSDAELVALLLRTGSAARLGARRSRRRCCAATAVCAGSRARRSPSCAASPASAEAKGATLLAAFELGRRVASLRLRPGDPIRSPADVHRHFHPLLRDAPHERFLVVLLDGRHRVIRPVLTSQGTLTASLVHPREVFAPGAARAGGRDRARPQPPERRPDAEPGGSRGDRAARGGGRAPRESRSSTTSSWPSRAT